MNKLWHIWMVVFVLAGFPALAGEAPTVLAFGDSITAGGTSFVCYRQVLIPQLNEQNAAYEFIGPNEDSTSAHAGYGGKNTKYLRRISTEVYQKFPADIVMLHSGHNSFSNNQPVPGIVRDTEAIIQNISVINPDVRILLAQVIPSGKLPKYSYIPELNKELESLASRLSKNGYHVLLVNQAKGFDWKTDTVGDKVHPNAAGAKKMADRWMEALSDLTVKSEANQVD
tara:strand:+ start:369 stop:1049 length:681 start_codon:yes stop_codon:yes gene_type:complete